MEEQPSRHANNAEEQPLPRKVEERLTLQDRGPPTETATWTSGPPAEKATWKSGPLTKSDLEVEPSDEKQRGRAAL